MRHCVLIDLKTYFIILSSLKERGVFGTKTATQSSLTVGLGNSFELVLLLDGVGVGASLGGVHDLVSEALGDGLDVSESSFSSTGADEPDSLRKLEV